MINKNLDLVDACTFADVHESYPDHEREQIYDELFEEHSFSTPDLILLTGAPSEYEESQRRELLLDYMEEISSDHIPKLLTTESHRRELLQSGLDESNYIFSLMEPESSMDEVLAAGKHLSENENLAVITNDYHVPRYETILNNTFSENGLSRSEHNYILLGAEFSEDEFMYSSKWVSEAARTFLPQNMKDIGKRHILDR